MVFLDRNWCRIFFGEFRFGSVFLYTSSQISCDFHEIWWHFVIKNRLKIEVKFYIDFELDFWWIMSHFGGNFGSLGPSFWHHFWCFSCRSPREAIWEPFGRHLGGIVIASLRPPRLVGHWCEQRIRQDVNWPNSVTAFRSRFPRTFSQKPLKIQWTLCETLPK